MFTIYITGGTLHVCLINELRCSVRTIPAHRFWRIRFILHSSELEGCGVTQDDADDLATCLVIARKAGATEL